MEITIENATLRHLERLCEIEMQCFESEAFTRQQIVSLLKEYNSIGLIAKVNGKIVGFLIGALYSQNGKTGGHILTLDVLPEYRRKRIGLRLMLEVEAIFKERGASICTLEVRENNVAALRLYEKLEYKKIATLRHYYVNAHGILLQKELT